MDILIRLIQLLIFLIVTLFVGVEDDMQPPPPPPTLIPTPTEETDMANTMDVPIFIDEVTVNLLESDPVQVQLEVVGTIQDGCDFPVLEEIMQDGDTFTVTVYREVETDVMCPMNIVLYENTIDLGAVEPGSYTVNINDVTVSFDV